MMSHLPQREQSLPATTAINMHNGAPVLDQTKQAVDVPFEHLKNDYNQVSVVAHVQVKGIEVADELGDHVLYLVRCQVVEPLKGRIKLGQSLEYYHSAEGGAVKDMLGEKIVFLTESLDKVANKQTFSSLQNSTLPYSKETFTKLIKVRDSKES